MFCPRMSFPKLNSYKSLLWLVRLLSSMPFKDVNEVTGSRAPEVGSLFAAAPSWELSCLLQRTGAD